MDIGPLSGVKVVECSIWGFGPIGGLMLGDLGADVIKIESPRRPDPARHVTNVVGIEVMMEDGRSACWQSFNRNKRSLALDLKSERGREVLKALVREADIFLENYRPGVFDKLGLGYEELSKINPRLIYASTAGYGFEGPEANKPALDVVGQARSGFMWTSGAPGDPPMWNSQGVADVMGATCVAYGVLAALAARELHGVGQKVEISHIMANMWLSFWGISVGMMRGYEDWPRFDRTKAGNPLWNLYECGDGEWLILGIAEADPHWPGFCKEMGLTELIDDPRFNSMDNRRDNAEELIRILDRRFREATRAEWEERLARNPDLIYSRVQRLGDLLHDPAVQANNYLADHPHRHYGATKMLTHPVTLRKTPAAIRRDAPDLGEHTGEVLSEWLGYDGGQIADLASAGVTE